MRPDLPQDPHPEHEVVPAPRDPRVGRYDEGWFESARYSGGRFDTGRFDGRAAEAPPSGSFPGIRPARPHSDPRAAGPTTGGSYGSYGTTAVGPAGPPAPAPYAATPYSGPQPAAHGMPSGPFAGHPSGPVPAGRATPAGGLHHASDPTIRQAGASTLRQRGAERPDDRYAGYVPEEDDRHPSGPLPVGARPDSRRRERRAAVPSRRRLMIALLAAGAVVAGAAGYVALAHWGTSSEQASVATTATAAGAQSADITLTGANLGTRETPLGVVATSDGYTVYSFTQDSNRPARSTCTDECATTWPPVLASDTPWLKGVNPEDVGTVDRPDGTRQLTLGGWPVYRYAQDTAPGQTSGNGVGGTWRAVGPNGRAVAPQSAASSAASPAPAAGTGSGSGYGSSSGY